MCVCMNVCVFGGGGGGAGLINVCENWTGVCAGGSFFPGDWGGLWVGSFFVMCLLVFNTCSVLLQKEQNVFHLQPA